MKPNYEKNEKGYINVFLSSYQEINTTQDSVYTNIKFDTRRAYKSNKFTINSDGTITIGKGVSTIEISARATMKNNTDTATYQRLHLSKNNNVLDFIDMRNGTNTYSIAITPIITDVIEGDVISLKEFNRLAGSTTINSANMTIKEI